MAEYEEYDNSRLTLAEVIALFEQSHRTKPKTAALVCGRWIAGPVPVLGRHSGQAATGDGPKPTADGQLRLEGIS